MSENKILDLRKYIAPFITGPNADSLVAALGDESQKQQDLSISVTNQLTISTSSGVYLDKRLSEKGIIRPPELGMSDLSFKRLGIKINSQKQITEIIQSILEVFYGVAAVRAYTITTAYGPFNLEDGDDLIFSLEDGIEHTVIFNQSDFNSIAAATASEIADAITRYISNLNLNGFADVEYDLINKKEYIRLFGGAKGPYSLVKVLGGKAQSVLRFPSIRPTSIQTPNTLWQITRTTGNTLRFRWDGNNRPALESIKPGDVVLLYSGVFDELGISGTYKVTGSRPAGTAINLNSGYFEISVEDTGKLQSTQPGQAPLPNDPPVAYYSWSVNQTTNNEIVFMLPKQASINSKIRYSAAYEPGNYLKLYLPATTNVISREIPGGAYCHIGQPNTTFNVVAGNAEPGISTSQGMEVTKIVTTADVSKSLQSEFIFIPYRFGYYGFWFDVDNTTSIPPYDMLLITSEYNKVSLNSNDSAETVAEKLSLVISSTDDLSCSRVSNQIIVTDLFPGPRSPDANRGSSPFEVTTLVQGSYVYNDVGSLTWNEKIKILSDHSFRFNQSGYDMGATGGTVVFNSPLRAISIDHIHREQFVTTVYCSEPHQLVGYLDPYGSIVTDETGSITIENIEVDSDTVNTWPGPYLPDAEKNYTLTSYYANISQPILAGQIATNIQIDGMLPNESGLFMLNLNQDNEEGPFKYIASQTLNNVPSVDILSASQSDYTITVTTVTPHGLLVGSKVQIVDTGTTIDGLYTVVAISSGTVFIVQSVSPEIIVSNTGKINVIIGNIRSTVLLDPANNYLKNHEAGSDITIISSSNAYEPLANGTSYPMYVTGTAQGRIYAQEIIESIAALGIKLEIKVLYPSDKGLGNEGGSDNLIDLPTSDAVYVWGSDIFYGDA